MSLESGYDASNESNVVNDVDGIADEQRAERPNLGKVPDQSVKNQQLFRNKGFLNYLTIFRLKNNLGKLPGKLNEGSLVFLTNFKKLKYFLELV